MIIYLDTSSLVKLYVDETDSKTVRNWTQEAEVLATSRVAYAEAMAALARRQREGSLDTLAFEDATGRLNADWEDFAVMEVDERSAGQLAVKHALRGFDAIHLAAAVGIHRAAAGAQVAFLSFDDRQLEAARSEGLVVLDAPGR